MPKIKDLPKINRPREKLIQKGPQNLKDEELLAIRKKVSEKGVRNLFLGFVVFCAKILIYVLTETGQ